MQIDGLVGVHVQPDGQGLARSHLEAAAGVQIDLPARQLDQFQVARSTHGFDARDLESDLLVPTRRDIPPDPEQEILVTIRKQVNPVTGGRGRLKYDDLARGVSRRGNEGHLGHVDIDVIVIIGRSIADQQRHGAGAPFGAGAPSGAGHTNATAATTTPTGGNNACQSEQDGERKSREPKRPSHRRPDASSRQHDRPPSIVANKRK